MTSIPVLLVLKLSYDGLFSLLSASPDLSSAGLVTDVQNSNLHVLPLTSRLPGLSLIDHFRSLSVNTALNSVFPLSFSRPSPPCAAWLATVPN